MPPQTLDFEGFNTCYNLVSMCWDLLQTVNDNTICHPIFIVNSLLAILITVTGFISEKPLVILGKKHKR